MTSGELNKVLNIVAFAILMENNEGITGKSPDYILEKFNRYCLKENPEWQWGLDYGNKVKLDKWMSTWIKNVVKEADSDSN